MLDAAVSPYFLLDMAILSENNEGRELRRIWRLSVTKPPCTVRRIRHGDVSGIFVVTTNPCRNRSLIGFGIAQPAFRRSVTRSMRMGQSSLSRISPSDLPICNFIQRFAGKQMTDVPI